MNARGVSAPHSGLHDDGDVSTTGTGALAASGAAPVSPCQASANAYASPGRMPSVAARVPPRHLGRMTVRRPGRSPLPAPRAVATTLLLSCCVPTAAPAQTPDTTHLRAPTVFSHVRVFDGKRVIPVTTVVLDGGRITRVVTGREPAATPVNARIIDGTGKTLLPGFIDAHTHTFNRAHLKQALAFGVMTHLDMFTSLSTMRALKSEQEEGRAADRADLFSAGTLITAPGGHGTQFAIAIPTLAGAGGAAAFVADRLAEGSDYIKVVLEDGGTAARPLPTLDSATLEAVIAAAHERGRLTVVHVSSVAAARLAIAAGADGLAHAFTDRPPDPDLGHLAAQHGVFVVPTLAVIEVAFGGRGGASLVDDPILGPRLFPGDIEDLQVRLPPGVEPPGSMTHAIEAVRLLRDAGATVLAGTDAPNPGTVHGASLHRELELLVEAGLTPTEALAAATAAAADAFGLPGRGRIAEGARADVILVDGDPTVDITATRAIAGVWKEGRRYMLGLYIEQARRLRAEARAAAAAAGSRPPGSTSGIIGEFDADAEMGKAPAASFGAGWATASDRQYGGGSGATMTVEAGGAGGSRGALAVRGQLSADARPDLRYAGVMFSPGPTAGTPADLSGFASLAFRAKGDGRGYALRIYHRRGSRPSVYAFQAGPEWREHLVTFADAGLDGRDVTAILFTALGAPGPFAFQLDDVRLR